MTAGGDAAGVVSFLVGPTGRWVKTVRWSTPTADTPDQPVSHRSGWRGMLPEGKPIVVTGGNTGIGKAIVLAAATEGANVVVDYVMHPKYTAEVTAAAGRAGGCAVGVEADVSRTDDLRRLIQTAVAEFGRLDVPVSNAGIETRTSLLETSEADFDKVAGRQPQGRVLRRPVRGAAVRGATQRRADRDDLVHPRRLVDARQHRLLRLEGRRQDTDGHRFLVEERAAAAVCSASGPAQAPEQDS